MKWKTERFEQGIVWMDRIRHCGHSHWVFYRLICNHSNGFFQTLWKLFGYYVFHRGVYVNPDYWKWAPPRQKDSY